MLSRPTFPSFHVAHSQFYERLGFARWLAHLRTGVAPTHAEIARAVSRTGPAVGAWMSEAEPPSDYRVHGPLAEYLEVEGDWLIRDVGEPPRPELWAAWLEARRPARREKAAFRPAGTSGKKAAPRKQA